MYGFYHYFAAIELIILSVLAILIFVTLVPCQRDDFCLLFKFIHCSYVSQNECRI